MEIEITQDKKEQLRAMEKQLRVTGQKLDLLWTQARNATGQSKIDIHKQIAPLREKQSADRKAHEGMKLNFSEVGL